MPGATSSGDPHSSAARGKLEPRPIAETTDRAWAYPPALRALEALLRAAAYLTALALAWSLALGTFLGGPPPEARRIVRVMAAGALLPYAAAVALRRSRRIRLDRGALRPSMFRAWRLPLPAPGFRLLRDAGPRDLVLPPGAALALDVQATGPAERFALHWTKPSLKWLVLKFGLYPLVPALIVFRADQVIGYGGFMAEYQLYGFQRWATNLALHWAVTEAVMAAWAAVWRVAAEAASLLGAFAGPRAARWTRRGAEIAVTFAYYAAVPVALAALFLR